MSWHALKPRGLADQPSVRAQRVALASLILIALAIWPFSAFPESPTSGANDRDFTEIAAGEYLAKTLSPTRPPSNPSFTPTNPILTSYTIRHTAPEVRLQFSVADDGGRLVTDLSANDIRILDNDYAVARIRQFTRADDLPLQIGLLLDVSDSVQKTVFREKQATKAFVERVVRPQVDRAFVMAFGRDLMLWQASTGDSDTLYQAVRRIHQLGDTTSLYDGVFYARRNQFPNTSGESLVQRIILLFSDGQDTGSFHGLDDAIAQAQRRQIQIYALSLHPGRKYAPGDGILRRLADETGGQLYIASSEKDFPAIFAAMERQMRTQYYVSFPPERPTPGFHDLRIETTSSRKLRIRGRQGYYFDAPLSLSATA